MAEKAAWRDRFRHARAGLSDADRTAASAAIVARVAPLLAGADVVSLFWPLVGRAEVDVRPLVAQCLAAGQTVALPAVAGASPPRLVHRAMRGEADLVAGPWGLREPSAACPLVAPDAVDVAVVPALGLGRDGSRVGYGGGYYDAFLAQTTAWRVGVAWSVCLVASLPTGATDARLDVVVTDAEAVWRRGDPVHP